MEQSSSPKTTPVEPRECIEELVKFILESHVNESLGFDLGLSEEFCFYLLRDDPSSGTSDSFGSLLHCPLYKHLASNLHESITYGVLRRKGNKKSLVDEDESLKEKEDWNELVQEKGCELINILKTINFELHVQEPFFRQLKDGHKTIEGRCAVGDYKRIESSALILFNKCLVLEVQDIHRHASFSEMLEAEGLAKVLPGVKTINEGVQVYRKFYTEEKENLSGVLAICVAKSAAQPYVVMAEILSGLSYEGIQSLLGLTDVKTVL